MALIHQELGILIIAHSRVALCFTVFMSHHSKIYAGFHVQGHTKIEMYTSQRNIYHMQINRVETRPRGGAHSQTIHVDNNNIHKK